MPDGGMPTLTLVAHLSTRSGIVTSIARTWPAGSAHCGRCPYNRCSLTNDTCLVTVATYVPDHEAADFRIESLVAVRLNADGSSNGESGPLGIAEGT